MKRVRCLLLLLLALSAVAVSVAEDADDNPGDDSKDYGYHSETDQDYGYNSDGDPSPGFNQSPAVEPGNDVVSNDDTDSSNSSSESRSMRDGLNVVEKPGWPIEFAPEAELINGIDDIQPDGNCTAEIKQYCDGIEPGAARLADCLAEQVEAEETDSASAENLGTVSSYCKTKLLDFKVLRSTNINMNTNLAKNCKFDADKYCNNTRYKSGQVVTCLRELKEWLTAPCQQEVSKVQLDAALDYRVDVTLFQACQEDAGKQCAGVEAGGGRVQACLREKHMKLSWACAKELARQEVENADDIRLSVQLFRKCLGDKKKYCADAPPGNSCAMDCLLEHREEEGFSTGCGEELYAVLKRRVRDFRLDQGLQRDCKKDIINMCAWFEDQDEMDTNDVGIVRCLQNLIKQITNPACKKRVHGYRRLSSQDIRFNVPLADNCFDDRRQFCANVPPGSARVIRCLEANRERLSVNCRATLLDEEQRFAESIEFQYPMRRTCLQEMHTFCEDVPPGNARVIRCLQEKQGEKGFGEGCKEEVVRYEHGAAGDFRLNFRLKSACEADVHKLCKGVCQVEEGQICDGSVQRCLMERMEGIKREACIQEVTYAQRKLQKQASDGRYDSILAEGVSEACRQDVLTHCSYALSGAAGDRQGTALIHTCLRKNLAKLSVGCNAEELQQQETEAVEAAGKDEAAPKLHPCAAACVSAKRDQRWFWWGRCAWCKVQGGLSHAVRRGAGRWGLRANIVQRGA